MQALYDAGIELKREWIQEVPGNGPEVGVQIEEADVGIEEMEVEIDSEETEVSNVTTGVCST
ncbi:hypothetical protein QBC45DRAFT_456122 [Copromyces sp. CBS 386.78]|nr:hypothetical protein QBC45DRAFT_456122 [Copromyces sp. CBS 386.78]